MIAHHVQAKPDPTYWILIVDDNEAIHRDFRSLLQTRQSHEELDDLALAVFGEEVNEKPDMEMPKYAFESAYQGRAALETVKEASTSGRSYALAFVDVRMPPGWDGVETIQRLWEVDPDIHVVICSAYSDYTWDDLVDRFGPTDKLLFVRKPFDPTCIKQMALAISRKWSRERTREERIAALESEIGRRDRELSQMRADLAQLSGEVDRVAPATDSARETGEQVTQTAHLHQRVNDLLVRLEELDAVPLDDEQRALVQKTVEAARTLRNQIEWSTRLIHDEDYSH